MRTSVNTAHRHWMRGWTGLLICGLLGAAGGIIIGLAVVAGMVFRSGNHSGASGWPGAALIAASVGAILGFVPGLVFWFVLRAIEGVGDWLMRRGSRK